MPHIYHIAEAAHWAQAREDGEYRMSTRGRTLAEQGFIHASTETQLAGVANARYPGVDDLVVLCIDPDLLDAEIRYEALGTPDRYPHIYGPLPVAAVVDTRPLTADAEGVFRFQ